MRLVGGEEIAADWVISAADGHATIFDLLGGAYRNGRIDRTYAEWEPFPSYVQVSLGVARDLAHLPGHVMRLLDAPLEVDPKTRAAALEFRIFSYDPSFAPPGKTAVTCFVPTRDFAYWVGLRAAEPERYEREKIRLANAVVAVFESIEPGVRAAIEETDVSTPATVVRYTGNWRGSMEGWLLTPQSDFRPLRNTLPGLDRFFMIGQWTSPGGGLPSGLITARPAIAALCKRDGVPFGLHAVA